MMKFIMQNKKQFLTSLFINITVYIVVIFAIVININTYTDLESLLFGFFVTPFIVYTVKQYDKKVRSRVFIFIIIFIIVMRYSSTFILNENDVLSLKGMFLGFLCYTNVWNVADTIHNIRVKSKLVLKDLDS